MNTIGKKMAIGATWMIFMKLCARGLGLISTIILARLLVPEDFGLVAMATSIFAIIEILSSFSFDVVLIQKQDANREHYDTAWSFNVLFGMFNALLLIVLAIPAAMFYSEPRVEGILYALAVGAFVQGFENIGIVQFRKEFEFSKEFKFQVSKKIVSFFITIPLAYFYHSYWALVVGIVTGQIFGVVLSYIYHNYRPSFTLAARAELFNFSIWLLINNMLYFARFKFADFVVGRYTDAKSLGLYSVAFEIANLPSTELVAPINRAIFPGYSKMAGDMAALKEGFLNVIAVISFFALPITIGMYLEAAPIIDVMLGSNWLDAAPIIQIFALFGAIVALQSNITSVFIALGKARATTFLTLGHALLLIPMLIYSVKEYQLMGAAWAYLISMLVFFPINYYIVFKILGISVAEFGSRVWRSFASVVIMYLGVSELHALSVGSWINSASIVQLLVDTAVGAVIYAISILILWSLSKRPDGPEGFIVARMQGFVRRLLA